MIRKLVRQMLTAQILSALTVSLCLLIDNIMIGRYLGEDALASYTLASPVLLVIGAVGSMLCAGVQVACSKSLGRGSRKETNAGYSSAVIASAVFSAAFVLVVMALRMPLAKGLGAKTPALLRETSGYMAGFVIGAPASMGALILVPFLQLAGQSGLLIAAVLGMTVADVAFDLLNVLVFHGGMFGMGLASSLSYYVAMLIGGGYFLSKKCVFRFSMNLVSRAKIRELFAGGVPTVVGMASSVVLVLAVNRLLLPVGGSMALAAYGVINTLINASNCISTGTGGVALTLSGILYNEEDRTGLKELIGVMAPYSIALGVIVAGLLIVFAPVCVGIFITKANATRALTVLGLRLFALGLVPCCFNNTLKNCWQGTGRVRLMEVISALEGALLPTLAAFVLSRFAGTTGVWCCFFAGEALTTLIMLLLVRRRSASLLGGGLLMLTDDFGVSSDHLLEGQMRNIDDVMAFSRKADAFCQRHGGSRRLGNHLALCVEEMGSNIVKHGFGDAGTNNLSIRLQHNAGRWTLRFRDDCMAFDPISHVTEGATDENTGIRLAMRIADEARYTYSMNLNNLTLILRDS